MLLLNFRTFLALICVILLKFFVIETTSKPFPKINHEKNQELISTLEKFLSLYYDTHIQKFKDFEKSQIHEVKHSKKHNLKHEREFFDIDEIRYFEPEKRVEKSKRFENYDDENSEDIYDRMQGDQPVDTEENVEKVDDAGDNSQQLGNAETPEETQMEAMRAREKRPRRQVEEGLRKDQWLEYIKNQVLRGLGRENMTAPIALPYTTEDPALSNISDIIPSIINRSNYADDDQITEKIRSFYPSCESPSTDTEIWRDEDIMNLYFDIDYLSNSNSNTNIATATLRLYRIPQNVTSTPASGKDNDCDNLESSTEEEKLLRVTVYWYTKTQKKRRGKHVTDIKRRLSDSRVVSENARWVELSVKPATKAWNKVNAKNMGLGVLVEDQEGKTLRADKYFKGAACTVGMSTPKPIPTIIKDVAIGQSNELDRIHSLLGRDSNSTLHSDLQLLPSVDICILELPDQFNASHFDPNRINACNLRKRHEEKQRQQERERQERLATLSEHLVPMSRHIRHQSHHLADKMAAGDGQNGNGNLELDFRSRIANRKIVLTREQVENLTQEKNNNKFVLR